MANSELPETGLLAQKIAELCNGPMVFRNLEVRRVEEDATDPKATGEPTGRSRLKGDPHGKEGRRLPLLPQR